MGLFDEQFDGWQPTDFAAFEQRKWASNRFNLERGRVRRRLVDLLEKVRAAAAADLDELAIWTSPDHPKLSNGHRVRWQAAAFCRSEAMRLAIERCDPGLDADDVRKSHVHLGVVVEQELLRMVLFLPASASLDRRKWPQAQPIWQQLASQLNVSLQEEEGAARIEHVLRVEEVLAGAAQLAWLTDWLRAALPALRAALWRPADDPEQTGAEVLRALSISRQMPTAPAPTPQRKPISIAPAGSKSDEPEPPRRAHNERLHKASRDANKRHGDRTRSGQGHRARDDSARSDASERRRGKESRHVQRGDGGKPARQGRGPRRHGGARGPYELGPKRAERRATSGEIAVGARVSLRSGLFAGKEGEVVSLKKGQAEVAIGPMTVHVTVSDLLAI